VQAWTEKDDKKRINSAISTAIAYFHFLLHRKRTAKIMTIMSTDGGKFYPGGWKV
jgi:hypothetical protein